MRHSMVNARVLVLLTPPLVILVSLTPISMASATARIGTSCPGAGAVSTNHGVKYSCLKINGRFIWSLIIKSKTNSKISKPAASEVKTPTIAPTPVVSPTLNATELAINKAKQALAEARYQYCVAENQLPLAAAQITGTTPSPSPIDCGVDPSSQHSGTA